jgi:hypothetical protein
MILATVESVNGVLVRLTDERWDHILDGHLFEFSSRDMDLILETIADPDYILRGYKGTLIAVLVLGRRKYLHVIYKEVSAKDGFIITANIRPSLDKRKIIWRRGE